MVTLISLSSYEASRSPDTHTLLNVEFLHETEDVLGEHFGLDLIHAVSGNGEAREAPVATQV